MPLIPVLRAAALGLALLASPAALGQGGGFTEAQRAELQGIIRDYLVKNPEVLQEALVELDRRQQEAQRTAQASALKEAQGALQNSASATVAGNPQGDVTLVEFFDYNCGYCKRALGDLKTIIKADPKVRLVLKDFPVLGPESLEAHRVALAVKQQLKGERMFDYHVRLMESRGRVNGERAKALAKEMGVDMARLDKDAESAEVRAAIQENVVLGDRLGLTGTPAYVVGDEVVSGAVGVEPLRQALGNVRKCGKASC
jgi:protein-disulfide isomerase